MDWILMTAYKENTGAIKIDIMLPYSLININNESTTITDLSEHWSKEGQSLFLATLCIAITNS